MTDEKSSHLANLSFLSCITSKLHTCWCKESLIQETVEHTRQTPATNKIATAVYSAKDDLDSFIDESISHIAFRTIQPNHFSVLSFCNQTDENGICAIKLAHKR